MSSISFDNNNVETRVSLYEHDCGNLVAFIKEARKRALADKERFQGISVDIDTNGFVRVYAAKMDTPLNL